MAEIPTKNQPENKQIPVKPVLIFETSVMSAEQIRQENNKYAAAGINAKIIDVSKFAAKHELQTDGSYKRTAYRHGAKQ